MHRRITGRLVIATHNPGKLAEMRELLAPHGVEAVSAGELGLGEPEETGQTFRANAAIKAIAAANAAQLPAFADDSGLVVDALDGAPGIYSARWAGEGKDFMAAMSRIERLLQERGATAPGQRGAHFVSALCVAWPDGHLEEVEARVDGTLVWPPRGTAGFGYDPAFLPDGHDRTFGEMTSIEKHGLPRSGSACRTVPAPSSNWRRSALASPHPTPPHARAKEPSASTCTGRSACRNARIAISTAMSGMRRSTRSALRAPLRARSKPRRRVRRTRTVTSIFLGGGTPSLMQPQTVGAILDAIGKALARRAQGGSDAGGQSHQRRGNALSRLSHRRRQPRLARRAGAGRRLAEGAGTAAYRARGAGCGRDRPHRVRPLFVRPDLRPPRPDAADVGR